MPDISAHWDRPPTAILPPSAVKDAFEGEFVPAMNGATNLIRSEIVEFTPHFLGNLRNSIHTRKASVSGGVIVGKVSTPSPYALPVEDGSRPHWPPLEPLKLWAKRKLGDESLAFLIQRKIARSGTKAHRMFQKGFDKAEPAVLKILEGANARFVERLGR